MIYRSRALTTANTFGVFGYISLLFQWLWLTAVFLPPLLKNDTFKQLFLPAQTETLQPLVNASDAPSIITIILGVLVTAVVIIVSLVILLRLPSTIAKSGSKVVHETAHAFRPVVTHHKKISVSKMRQIDARIVVYIKIVLGVAPLLLLGFLPLIAISLANDLIVLMSSIVALATFVWFGLQYATAYISKVPTERLI